ncbi:MAG: RNA methyltransferase, partial [Aurantibacter sp.]
MDGVKHIGSLQNPLIKKILLLKEKSRERKKTGLFVLEGLRELQLALKGNYRIKTLLYQEDLVSWETIS